MRAVQRNLVDGLQLVFGKRSYVVCGFVVPKGVVGGANGSLNGIVALPMAALFLLPLVPTVAVARGPTLMLVKLSCVVLINGAQEN